MKPTTLAASLALASSALASPVMPELDLARRRAAAAPLSVPLTRREVTRDQAWFLRKTRATRNRYGHYDAANATELGRRSDSTGEVTLTNYGDA